MANKVENTILKKLPSYRNPPVNEVVCGMRIRPIDKLLIPHIGLIWNKFKSDYPNIQHAKVLSSPKGEIPIDKVSGLPIPRVWFINSSEDQLIQFQIDRFYFNWRKRKDDYPRYKHVISNFEKAYGIIGAFLDEFNLGELEPLEYELSYINHIPKGDGWETLDDLSNVFSDFTWKKVNSSFLPSPEEFSWEAQFPLPEQKGVLSTIFKKGIRAEDELPVLVCQLKAIGFDNNDTARNWFDLAHKWIVQGFTEITTKKMHKIWGIEEND